MAQNEAQDYGYFSTYSLSNKLLLTFMGELNEQ